MSDSEYYGLMEAVDVVLCLTTRAKTFQSGASEALWLGKPIITSAWPVLKAYFSKGTEFVDNSPESIVQAVNKVLANLPSHRDEIAALQAERREEWWQRMGCSTPHIPGQKSENGDPIVTRRHCMVVHAYYPYAEVRVERQVDYLLERGFEVDVICLRIKTDRLWNVIRI